MLLGTVMFLFCTTPVLHQPCPPLTVSDAICILRHGECWGTCAVPAELPSLLAALLIIVLQMLESKEHLPSTYSAEFTNSLIPERMSWYEQQQQNTWYLHCGLDKLFNAFSQGPWPLPPSLLNISVQLFVPIKGISQYWNILSLCTVQCLGNELFYLMKCLVFCLVFKSRHLLNSPFVAWKTQPTLFFLS